MQLFSAPISPYAARCRIQILHKNLPVEIVPPPGGMSSDEVKAANPIGKIPILKIDNEYLAESWAIMEFIENSYPVPAMRPQSHLEAARQTALVRFVDLQFATAMFPMFLALAGRADDAAVEKAKAELQVQTGTLESLLAALKQDLELSLADAALIPPFWYGLVLAKHFDMPDLRQNHPACAAWWNRVSATDAGAAVIKEMGEGLAAMMPPLAESVKI